ncbi:hypothetical protein [Spirosoma montaniterrae]|uniref:Secretion system C-terminal sorting domain-containing protein n=1 Tax=Spirosoma montaniterrae TaxID=1178516 RepID=A0A1P9WSY9_9BACT|nr:hypothetical protein [Spirosoma montaniterrae]AQG78479.1 hypothetical protein AWR27_03465 [Spirosoma montaniterrae]
MKTLIKTLAFALSLSIVTTAATFADGNPGGQTKTAAAYQTGIYSNKSGKLNIALDKDQSGTVLVLLKNTKGEVLYSYRVGKSKQQFRTRLDLNELPDGTYTVEISNGVDTTQQVVTLATKQPVTPERLIQTEAVARTN